MIISIGSNGNEKTLTRKVHITANGEEKDLVRKVYIDGNGQEKTIFASMFLTPLGSGQSFNIKNLFPRIWQDINIDNFFFSIANNVSCQSTQNYSQWGANVHLSFSKSYSNGILTCSNVAQANPSARSENGNVNVSLLCKRKLNSNSKFVKIFDLGNGTSFNISQIYEKYNELNANNFFFTTTGTYDITDYSPSPSYEYAEAGGGREIVKNYNAQTGTIAFYFHDYVNRKHGGQVSQNTAVHAYLIV